MKSDKKGRLICVGVGLQVGFQTSVLVKEHIEKADVVYYAISDVIGCNWIESLNSNCVNLSKYYGQSESRTGAYKLMVEAILSSVRSGLVVCGAFYGHPGVFAYAPNKAILKASDEGYDAKMLPGISAADCLYADLGIDPGYLGCQHYEATQFMVYKRPIDKSAYLILWQVGVTGDILSKRLGTSQEYIDILKSKLLKHYPKDHTVVLYQAATYPFSEYISHEVKLEDLTAEIISLESTLVVTPSESLKKDSLMLHKLSKVG